MTGYSARAQAVPDITNRPPMIVNPAGPLSSLWASDVFTRGKMNESLPKEVFKSLQTTIEAGAELDVSVADVVALALKDWALAKGALYSAHVLYPLTNATAEKHDSFISMQSDGSVISEFSGKVLVQGDLDGPSFLNGGIRSTFEARGYTAWDVTSPAFSRTTDNGATLWIPTVLVSWTGAALDQKTPLLRAGAAINQAAKRVLSILGHAHIASVNSSCGAEQEYFLVDANFVNQRPDLLLAGRTLLGASAANGQQFDDQYFDAIPERLQVYMQEVAAQLVVSLAKTGIYPVAVGCLSDRSSCISALKLHAVELDHGTLTTITTQVAGMMEKAHALGIAIKTHEFPTIEHHLQFCAPTIRLLMDEVRQYADALEGEIANELGPYPTYQEMLFIK